MASKREFWGLDLETSGTTHENHVPIQIGIVAPNGNTYKSLIGGYAWDGSGNDGAVHLWDAKAEEIHRILKESLEYAPYPTKVDHDAYGFVEDNSQAWLGERMIVGWNVASFDMPFVRQWLPTLGRNLSYRSVDLNAVCFAISEALVTPYHEIKMASKEYARQTLLDEGVEEQWHDALYDAKAALHSFEYLQWTIREGQ